MPRGVDGLAYWAVIPDENALMDGEKKTQPYNVPERQLHFIDLEIFVTGEAKRTALGPDLDPDAFVVSFAVTVEL